MHKTIKEVREEFITKGSKLLSDRVSTAIGEQNMDKITRYSAHNGKDQDDIVRTMMELIKAESDIKKIQVKNTADVLKALSSGDMSIRDAKEMVVLLAMINGETGDPESTQKIIIQIAEGGAK